MKRLLKIVFGFVGGLVLLMVILAVVLPMIYDTEDLKTTLSEQVKKQTGRELRIDGPLDFSVFPWVAVEVGDLRLSNAEGFGGQDFARISRARVGVALMPLFSKQLIADEVTLEGLQLSLAVKANGENNWDDLGGTSEEAASDTGEGGSLFSSQKIAGLNIRDSNIEYEDQQAGSHYKLSNFSLQAGALGDTGPVPLELSMQLEDLLTASKNDIRLSASASINLDDEIYVLENMELSLSPGAGSDAVSTEPILIRTPRLEARLSEQTLSLEKFNASIGSMDASGNLTASQILDDPVFQGSINVSEFSPRDLMQALAIESPSTTDPDVLKSARFSSRLEGSDSHLGLGDIALQLDQSQFAGELSIRNFDRPAIRFDFEVDSINIDRYLEPATETSESDVAIPSDEIRDVDLQGNLKVQQLQLAGLDLSNAVIGLSIANGTLRLNPLTAGFYDGQYEGNISLDSSGSTPVISLDERLDSITFKRLMADLADNEKLSGTGQAHVKLTGQGHTSNEVLRSLNGELGLTLDEGALEGINIWYEIRRAYALYKGIEAPEPEADRTVFSRMQFDASVSDGLLTTRKLIGDLPFLSLRGIGNVDLGQSNVDLQLTATVRDVPELADDEMGSELKGKQLPFKVSGALDDPKISVDWARLMQGEAVDILRGKLGLGSESDSVNDEPATSEDQAKEAATGLLFDLLGGKKKKGEKDDG